MIHQLKTKNDKEQSKKTTRLKRGSKKDPKWFGRGVTLVTEDDEYNPFLLDTNIAIKDKFKVRALGYKVFIADFYEYGTKTAMTNNKELNKFLKERKYLAYKLQKGLYLCGYRLNLTYINHYYKIVIVPTYCSDSFREDICLGRQIADVVPIRLA